MWFVKSFFGQLAARSGDRKDKGAPSPLARCAPFLRHIAAEKLAQSPHCGMLSAIIFGLGRFNRAGGLYSFTVRLRPRLATAQTARQRLSGYRPRPKPISKIALYATYYTSNMPNQAKISRALATNSGA